MQPGGSGKIPVTLSTRNRNGPLKKGITVYTNVPGQAGTLRITIQGQIWQPVAVTPRTASFGRLTAEAAQNSPPQRRLTIINNMEQPANLTDLRSTNPLFHVESTTVEPGKKYELTVTVASSPGAGSNYGKIEMSTGVKEMPRLSIPVSLYVMADVDVRPDRLMLPRSRPAEMKRQFTIRNNTKQPLKITDLKTTNPALKITLQATRPGMMYRLMVTVPTDFTAAPGGDKITFKTDCPTVPEVTILIMEFPVRGKPAQPRTVTPAAITQPEKKSPGAKRNPGEGKTDGGE